MKEILLSKRLKSFYWFMGMACLSTIISVILSNIDLLTPYISPAFIIVLTGILQQISKGLSNYIDGKDMGFVK